jgi:DNA-binding transcriptional regulator YiaG
MRLFEEQDPPADYRIPSPDELARMRRICELTQTEVAEEIGVTAPTVSHWERVHTQPSTGHVAALLETYAAHWPDADDDVEGRE